MGGPTTLATNGNGWSERERLAQLATVVDSHSDRLNDHEGRLRAAERRIYLAAGAAAALGSTVGGGVGAALSNLLGH